VSEEDRGGIIDDVKTAIEWEPILPLLAKLKASNTVPERLDSVLPIIQFICVHGFRHDPRMDRWFLVVRKAFETVKADQQWQAFIRSLFQ